MSDTPIMMAKSPILKETEQIVSKQKGKCCTCNKPLANRHFFIDAAALCLKNNKVSVFEDKWQAYCRTCFKILLGFPVPVLGKKPKCERLTVKDLKKLKEQGKNKCFVCRRILKIPTSYVLKSKPPLFLCGKDD